MGNTPENTATPETSNHPEIHAFLRRAQQGKLPRDFSVVVDNDALYGSSEVMGRGFDQREFILATLEFFGIAHENA